MEVTFNKANKFYSINLAETQKIQFNSENNKHFHSSTYLALDIKSS